jgi:hypothetical protein
MKKPAAGNVEQIRAHAFTCLAKLIVQVFSAGCATAEFQEAREALEALPLTTAEITIARNRLNNAQHYLQSGECGAAQYELRLLRRNLEQ